MNAQTHQIRKAERDGWQIAREQGKVFAVKGFGLILRVEIFEDGSQRLSGFALGVAGSRRPRLNWDEPSSF